MVRIKIDLSESTGALTNCGKCDNMGWTDRHHKAHQKMWMGFFQNHYGGDYNRFMALKDRYAEFHPDDIIRLCRDCHEKVHKHYRKISNKHRRKLGGGRYWKRFNRYTWEEAEDLMQILTNFCDLWVEIEEFD